MVIFNIIPDSPIREDWLWKTDVLTTINGSESRISIFSKPRILLNNRIPVVEMQKRSDQWKIIFSNVKNISETPLWQYSTYITQEVNSGNSRIFFDTSFVPSGDSGLLILFNMGTNQISSHEISSMETDGATLVSSLSFNLTTDFLCILGFQANIDSISSSLGQTSQSLNIMFSSKKEIDVQRPNSVASLATYDGFPLLERKFKEGSVENFHYDKELIDFNTGARNYFSQIPHPVITGRRSFIINRIFDSTDFDYWRLFLDTVKGSWKPFLISTQMEDLTVNSIVQNASSFSVNEDVSSLITQYESFKRIKILYSDGTSSNHTITSTTGSGPFIINITPNIPNDPKVNNIARISYLQKSFMSDKVIFNHETTITEISFDITTTDYG